MDSGQNPMNNWQELQKSLIKQVPLATGLNSNGIEKYVQKAIKGYMQNSMPHQPNYHPLSAEDGIEYDLFETQRTIFVRFKVPDKTFKNNIRFFANTKKLRIEYSGNSQQIKLPGDVDPVRAFARTDGDVMEISLPRTRDSAPFREIFIRE
jgi:HSP20 family molecular chaperone IbpA